MIHGQGWLFPMPRFSEMAGYGYHRLVSRPCIPPPCEPYVAMEAARGESLRMLTTRQQQPHVPLKACAIFNIDYRIHEANI